MRLGTPLPALLSSAESTQHLLITINRPVNNADNNQTPSFMAVCFKTLSVSLSALSERSSSGTIIR